MDVSGIVGIHGGGAGSMIGESMWIQLIKEHGISPDGIKDDSVTHDVPGVMFQDIDKECYRPRGLFIDPDAQDADRIRKGMLKQLWSQDNNFVTWNKDAGNLYTEGFYSTYYCVNEEVNEKLRHVVEPVDQLGGFLLSRSISGGTGSGLIKRIMSDIVTEYPKRPLTEVCVFPSKRYSSIPIEPYNAMFAIDTGECRSCYTMLVSNEGVGDYIANAFSKPYCSMAEINSVIARLMCNVTCLARMSGERVLDKLVNTVAYPGRVFNMSMPSYSVLQDNSTRVEYKVSLTRQVFREYTQLLGYPLGRSMGTYLSYLGNTSQLEVHSILASAGNFDMSTLSANTSISAAEKWVPTSVFGDSPAPYSELAHVSVNMGVLQALKDLARKYDRLFAKRAYVHWIAGSISDEHVQESRSEVQNFIQDMTQAFE